MAGLKKPTIPLQSSHNSLQLQMKTNPLNDSQKSNRSNSEGNNILQVLPVSAPRIKTRKAASESDDDKENLVPSSSNCSDAVESMETKSDLKDNRALKPSSLQLCMQLNEPDSAFGFGFAGSETSNSVNIWDYSDSEAAPASSWSTLPNRALLCRPLPTDIGRCICIIAKEELPQGFRGSGALYSLYTNEGQGRQNRKLAVAYHKRRIGHSEYVIAQNLKGVLSISDDSFIGFVTANFMGSRYYIWNQGILPSARTKICKQLHAVVTFMPTIATWTGSYRRMRVWIPKNEHVQSRNTTQINHVMGLHNGWEGKMDKAHLLHSRAPQYNKISKQYELDFRERGRAGVRVQTSVKNFQLIMEGNGRQTILQLGRLGKSKYVMDYRYPLSGYQAFCICLASIDSKLCFSV
ncbi:hypothetical protein Ancab_029882 [Ancistrocladus abbreviatus]